MKFISTTILFFSVSARFSNASFDPTYPIEFGIGKGRSIRKDRPTTPTERGTRFVANIDEFDKAERAVFDAVENAEKAILHVVEDAVHDEVETLFHGRQDRHYSEQRKNEVKKNSVVRNKKKTAFVRGNDSARKTISRDQTYEINEVRDILRTF